MEAPKIKVSEFSENVGQIILHLPYLASQSRHENVKDYLYYLDPSTMGAVEFEWQFVKDLFTMPIPEVSKRWQSLTDFHSWEAMKKVEWL